MIIKRKGIINVIFLILMFLALKSVNGKVFDFKIRNISNDNTTNIIIWTNIKASKNEWVVANQYIEINYLTNHSVITGWGFSIYTHNTTNIAEPVYTGSNDAAGLVGTNYSDKVISTAWLIKETKSTPSNPTENSGTFSTPDWHWMLDKSSSDYTNEKEYVVPWNQAGIAWHEAVRQKKPLTAYLYIAAKFQNLLVDVYRTTQLRFEEYANQEAKFLNTFYIYTNKWEDANPVPNHGVPAPWGTTSFTDVSSTYHSSNTCMQIILAGGVGYGSGLAFDEPNVGTPAGPGVGYDITGATSLSFWIKGKHNYTNNQVFANIGDNSGNDSCGVVKDVDGMGTDRFNVTTSWSQHYIPLSGINLSHVKVIFNIGAGWISQNTTFTLYIDDVKYEK